MHPHLNLDVILLLFYWVIFKPLLPPLTLAFHVYYLDLDKGLLFFCILISSEKFLINDKLSIIPLSVSHNFVSALSIRGYGECMNDLESLFFLL